MNCSSALHILPAEFQANPIIVHGCAIYPPPLWRESGLGGYTGGKQYLASGYSLKISLHLFEHFFRTYSTSRFVEEGKYIYDITHQR